MGRDRNHNREQSSMKKKKKKKKKSTVSGRLHNCGNTIEATTLLHTIYKTKTFCLRGIMSSSVGLTTFLFYKKTEGNVSPFAHGAQFVISEHSLLFFVHPHPQYHTTSRGNVVYP